MITRTKLTRCPHCGTKLDSLGDLEDGRPPGPGDVSVCVRCGGVMVIGEGLGVRAATKEEMRVFDRDPEIQKTRFFVQHVLPGIKRHERS